MKEIEDDLKRHKFTCDRCNREVLWNEKWRFDKFIPQDDDVEIMCDCLDEYFKASKEHNPSKSNFFSAGFYRGCRWMMFKLVEELNKKPIKYRLKIK